MKIPPTLLAFALILSVSMAWGQEPVEDVFIQLADPQFGMYTQDQGFEQETVNYEFVIGSINRLRPAFVIICGDLINKPGDSAQRDEYLRISAKLDPSIHLYAVAGNHDVGNAPTPESLAKYRADFGPDFYAFEEGSIYGIVLNSSLISAPDAAPSEAAVQEAWLRDELGKARRSGAAHIVVFQHHPWFIETAEEPDAYFNIPTDTRKRYLSLFKDTGVRYIFAGHYHRNAHGFDGPIEMITSGPVGQPIGEGVSGLRVVRVTPEGLEHQYYSLGKIPNKLEVANDQ